MQALAELAVLYPVNGAFTMYICRFVDPSWGFACGWQYAHQLADRPSIRGLRRLQHHPLLA
jgi:amino acid permease